MGEQPEHYMPALPRGQVGRQGEPQTPTHSQHALLQVPGHLPADALLDVSACHSLIFVED